MRKLFGAVLGLTIAVLGLVSSNDVVAQDLPKPLPLDKTLRPDQTAVVMVDFQNNFASPQGALYSLVEKQFRDSHMIENSLNLVNCRRWAMKPKAAWLTLVRAPSRSWKAF